VTLPRVARRYGLSLLSVVVALALWEAAPRCGWVSPVLVAPPSDLVVHGFAGLADGRWTGDLVSTFTAFGLAFALAIGLGAAVGILMGISRAVYHLVNPYVVALNALPKILLCPLVLVWFGSGLSARVFLGTLMAAFPIVTATVTGIQSIDRQFVDLARSYRASRRRILVSVLLPFVTPHVLSGARVGLNYAMVGVLVVELFSASEGVGFRLNAYSQNFQVDLFLFLIVLVAATVLALSGLLRLAETRLGSWRDAAFR
jgi:ABC-type nitrate/sulfonate/bicarbonate transport system permease component